MYATHAGFLYFRYLLNQSAGLEQASMPISFREGEPKICAPVISIFHIEAGATIGEGLFESAEELFNLAITFTR